ncbi:MAG: hypothetical protein WBW47_03655 [Thermoplasmata archaeon]
MTHTIRRPVPPFRTPAAYLRTPATAHVRDGNERSTDRDRSGRD